MLALRRRPSTGGTVTGLAVALASALLFARAAEASLHRAPPDTVLYNGKVSTVDARGSTVQAVAIRDGEILATGGNRKITALATRSTRVLNLRGRRVLPGLIDGHLHGLRNGYHCFSQAVRLDNVTSRSQALSLYGRKAAQLADGRWIFTTTGWTINQLDQPGMFTLAELDAAAPSNPVWVNGFRFQGVQVNSAALAAAGLQAGMPGVSLDAGGRPTGQLTGPALAKAGSAVLAQMDAMTIEQQALCLRDFIRAANALGLTGWNDPEGNLQPFNPAGSCQEFATGGHGHQPVLQLWRRNRLDARIAFHLMNDFSGLSQVLADTRHVLGFLGDDRLRYLGVGEEVVCPGNQPPPAAEYLEISKHLASNRLSFENHASASETQAAILDAWEQADRIFPISGLIWTIAHPGEDAVGPTTETLARARALGIGMTPSTGGALGRAPTGGPAEPGAQGTTPPFRRMLESGVRMCLSTDAMNVAPFTPFAKLWFATSGQTFDPNVRGVPADQRLTREQALRASTVECAWNLGQEGRTGSIERGKHADLIVVNRDYFRVPLNDIRKLRSVLTIVGGGVVHAQGRFGQFSRGPVAARPSGVAQ